MKWALTPPNYEEDLAFCIRVAKSKKMMAFISGIIINLKVEDKQIRATEVNFLCVHKKIRKHRVAPVLIKEVTRRSNVKGVWQGVSLEFNFLFLEKTCFELFLWSLMLTL